MLSAKLKELKKKGKENVVHKEPISSEDLVLFKTGPVLQLTNPLSLFRNVWFHVVLYWCRRGSEGQRELSITSYKFVTDERGNRYVTMAHDELSKNHPGGINDKPTNEKLARMYETKSETDGYKALKMYLSKTNPKCSALFQQPRRGWKEENAGDSCWYENRALGINSLASMMKQISKEAHLSQVYTNHCVRATAITVWGDGGFCDVQICHISAHKDPKNLQNYHHRPSRRQLRTCSNVLADALAGQDPNDIANANQQPQQQMAPVQLKIAPL